MYEKQKYECSLALQISILSNLKQHDGDCSFFYISEIGGYD